MTNALPGGTSFTARTYEELLADQAHDEVIGHNLTDKETLIGVPHMITRVSFRTSEYGETEYVSVEATAQGLGTIVYNDGSTGIRRQVMEYLIAKGIAVPASDLKVGGDETIADLSITNYSWEPPAVSRMVAAEDAEDGNEHFTVNCGVMVNCPRGLRSSKYQYTDEKGAKRPATTYYLG